MSSYSGKALIGMTIWFACMAVGYAFGNDLMFYVSLALWLIALTTFVVFSIQGK